MRHLYECYGKGKEKKEINRDRERVKEEKHREGKREKKGNRDKEVKFVRKMKIVSLDLTSTVHKQFSFHL